MPLVDMEGTSKDEFYMSLGFLALFYPVGVFACTFSKYSGIFVLSLYFADFLIWTFVNSELTIAQKLQTAAQQTFVGLILTSPLIYLLNHPNTRIF